MKSMEPRPPEIADNTSAHYSTDATGLPLVSPVQVVELEDGAVFALHITSVAKPLGAATLRMLAYNGSIPGPTLHVRQGSAISVQVRNDGDVEATVHWHGLRLENRYDGVPYDTQAPIPVGGTFTYRVHCPDAGIYWYHPHIREDYTLDMGLYGTIVVEPTDPAYWPPADRQLTLTLDDLLVEDGQIAPFLRSGPNYTAMGRFGNVLLINGAPAFTGQAAQGEVVRLYLVNTANTRLFNFALRGARMKLIGGDSGRYERETFVDAVLLAPSERAIVDVLFDSATDVRLEHRTPNHIYDLGAFTLAVPASSTAHRAFAVLRTDAALSAAHQALAPDVARPPDKVLAFVAAMPLLYGGDPGPVSTYACPMHPDVTAPAPGMCPRCGMALAPVPPNQGDAPAYACPMHPQVTANAPGTCPQCGMPLVPVQVNTASAPSYACPMHPQVTANAPGTCPQCGMPLVPVPANIAPAPAYTCPMHPAVTASAPGKCPQCGMKLVPVEVNIAPAPAYACPMHPAVTAREPGTCPQCGMQLVPVAGAEDSPPNPPQHPAHGEHEHGDGLEWEDLMPEINRASNTHNMFWQIIDRQSGAVNGAIQWTFTVGERVKIRLVNEMESDHPMHHPFHIHGAGRFLILARDGHPEANLVWKDTVLVRAGQTVDILLEVTNPGLWMAHCHIAEHAQSGMMFSFAVAPAAAEGSN